MISPFAPPPMEPCPLRLGQRVTVSPRSKYASEWPGEHTVVGLSWDYQSGGKVYVAIASDDDITCRHGATDGWSVDDLVAVAPPRA
jgi:hypothetical protein